MDGGYLIIEITPFSFGVPYVLDLMVSFALLIKVTEV
jgi:hypothetical protein